MKRMSSKEMKIFIAFLQKNLDFKTKELELFKTFPSQLTKTTIAHLIMPIQDIIIGLEEDISKLQKQIKLLGNPEIEKMNEEEFRKYITQ